MRVIKEENGWRYVETEPTTCFVNVRATGLRKIWRFLARKPLHWVEEQTITATAWVKGNVDFHLDNNGKTVIHTFDRMGVRNMRVVV